MKFNYQLLIILFLTASSRTLCMEEKTQSIPNEKKDPLLQLPFNVDKWLKDKYSKPCENSSGYERLDITADVLEILYNNRSGLIAQAELRKEKLKADIIENQFSSKKFQRGVAIGFLATFFGGLSYFALQYEFKYNNITSFLLGLTSASFSSQALIHLIKSTPIFHRTRKEKRLQLVKNRIELLTSRNENGLPELYWKQQKQIEKAEVAKRDKELLG